MAKRSRIRLQRAPIVLGVLEDRRIPSAFRDAFGTAFVPIAQVKELDRLIPGHLIDLIVVSPWDSTGIRVAPILGRSASRYRPLIAAYVDQRITALRELSALFRAGATEVILRGEDDSPAALKALRDRSGIAAVASEAMDIAAAVAPPSWLPLLQHYFAEACGAALSNASPTLRRTGRALSRLAYRAGVPGVRQTRSLCRLVVATGLMLRTGESVERAALRLGYESGPALHNLLRRHAGVRATTLHAHGGFEYWTKRLLRL
jgi:hypothetical protein